MELKELLTSEKAEVRPREKVEDLVKSMGLEEDPTELRLSGTRCERPRWTVIQPSISLVVAVDKIRLQFVEEHVQYQVPCTSWSTGLPFGSAEILISMQFIFV